MSIRFNRQLGRYDCGISVASMLLGVSYQKIRALWREFCDDPRCPGHRGIHLEEMEEFLLMHGGPWEQWKSENFQEAPLLVDWEPVASLNAIMTWQGQGYQSHWVAYCRGIVYDPHHDGPRLAKDCLRAPHQVIAGVSL